MRFCIFQFSFTMEFSLGLTQTIQNLLDLIQCKLISSVQLEWESPVF